MTKKYVIANWKGRLSLQQGREWLAEYRRERIREDGVRVIVAPPCLSLVSLRLDAEEAGDGLRWCAQDISPYPPGGYTGSIPAALLRGIADYVLVGHPERRRYFHEDVQEVANKAAEAVEAGITPVVCLDRENSGAQVGALADEVLTRMLVAYTPQLYGRTEKAPEDPAAVAEAVDHISRLTKRPVLYGGSINGTNVHRYTTVPGLAGLLVGRGSFDAPEFAALVRAVVAA